MRFSTITEATTAALVMYLPLASATVYYATRKSREGALSQVAWSNGTPDVCSQFTQIRTGDGNPCGIDFNVQESGWSNGPFTLQGCGGNGLSLERSHAFNSNCKWSKDKITCSGGAVIGTGGIWACF
ncbi:hypothetical protein B0T26DRAFT_443864 [Lasiosphaeria miniovina]|uniref:Uncharacterized protein n=1 Tax=Lasiosphaeria miniovina TaxID=1954250 RepID=A0AA39ZYT5_9PEZI|nr:uncharacterized protein B0T26DRAFT_443864 [Lasiosphaeria miniovina]KAK0706139.1 hypothetical protein B0T26DRAFT_443864 [Lasiosphaeria miniovina]